MTRRVRTTLLSPDEFKATFVEPMEDVTTTATEADNFWSYVAAVPADDLFGQNLKGNFIEYIARNGNKTFEHVLVPTNARNVYLVVVVDLESNLASAHHLLDLNIEYGLAARQ